jgi:BirA family biotin operon repressor/biotin-[acetyl-CoA-carboxylase] ligase
MATALAIADLCLHAGVAADSIRCKWPNDIVLLDATGTPRKVAGILVETRLNSDGWESAVLGTGINVNQQTDELPPHTGAALPATSLRLATTSSAGDSARPLDRADLFVALCRALGNAYALDNQSILERWRSLLWMPPGQILVVGGGQEYIGTMVGADEEGALLLREASGNLLHLPAGDLSLRPSISP